MKLPFTVVLGLTFMILIVGDSYFGDVPQIFLIGGQKCGSTSLWQLLSRHENICQNGVKEPQFFNTDRFRGGKAAYMDRLNVRGCDGHKLIIDGTPNYIQSSLAAERIAASYPSDRLQKKKFILVLREEITREYSLYGHMYRVCDEVIAKNKLKASLNPDNPSRNFCASSDYFSHTSCRYMACFAMSKDKLMGENPSQYFRTFHDYYKLGGLKPANSNYLHQLQEWLKYIPQQQMFIVNFETLVTNTTDVMRQLQRFLGFSTGWGDNVLLPLPRDHPVNATLDCETYDALSLYYQQSNAGLVELVNSPNRSSYQPYFPPFENKRYKCS